MDFGENMRKIRKAKGLRQVDIANEMITCQSYISSIETGRVVPTQRFRKLFCLLYEDVETVETK